MFLEPISFADTVMVPRNLMDELEDEEDHFTQGIATVVCEEECVVFSWSFNDLHSLFAHEPQLGRSLSHRYQACSTWLSCPVARLLYLNRR
jgi:hypothetical protein